MDVLTNLNFNKNEIQNVKFQNLATFPTNPAAGQIFFHTADKTYYGWNGVKWRDLGIEITGDSIVTLINSCNSKIDDDNLSVNANDAITKKHSHNNKNVLDLIQEAYTTVEKTRLANMYLKTEVDSAISTAVSGLINGAPGALDTLKELADAINDDKSFASTITNLIGAHTGDSTKHITADERTSWNSKTKKVSGTIGDGSATTFNINHNLNTLDTAIGLRELSTGSFVMADIQVVDANNIKILFAIAPTTGQYRVTIIG